MNDRETQAAAGRHIDDANCVDMSTWRPQTTEVVDSRYDQCFDVVKQIVALTETNAYDEHDRFAVSLSLHEAIANAIKHGNRSQPFKKVRIEYSVGEWEVRVRITDEGRGFDIESVRDPRLPENLDRPNGRGLLLMRTSMSGVRFNAAGNQVEIWKRRNVP
jgi:serine/threonine-protein kinase RsbW